ncbi:MAG TPA: DinB family protein [Thermoanaerobaculia bacterium]|nr:DinB family protein [Thermoanaerobaculia bacterium]
MRSKPTLSYLIIVLLVTLPIAAQHDHGKPATAKTPSEAFRAEMVGQLDYLEKQTLALAGAVPQEKYDWRPSEGIRSVAEAYLHVAQGNYFLGTIIGVAPPEGMDLRALDKAATDKVKVAEMMRASFDHARKMVKGLSDADLEKEVDFFGRKTTIRNVLVTLIAHGHEHLGQSIAYARVNGVKPPWSE